MPSAEGGHNPLFRLTLTARIVEGAPVRTCKHQVERIRAFELDKD